MFIANTVHTVFISYRQGNGGTPAFRNLPYICLLAEPVKEALNHANAGLALFTHCSAVQHYLQGAHIKLWFELMSFILKKIIKINPLHTGRATYVVAVIILACLMKCQG